MTALGVKAELCEDHICDLFILPEAEVGVLRLRPGALVIHYSALKGVENTAGEGAVVAAPEIPHHIQRRFVVIGPGAFDNDIGIVEQALTRVPHTAVTHTGKLAVLGHGYAAVVKQISVAAEVCAAVSVDEVHVAAQRLAFAEQGHIFLDQRKLVFVHAVGVGPIDGRPLICVQRVNAVVEDDGIVHKVAAVEHESHSVAGVTHYHPALELKAQCAQGKLYILLRGVAVILVNKAVQRLQ